MFGRLTSGVVTVRYRGQMGNHLAQYCLARRLATELQFDLAVPAIPGFPQAVSLGAGLRRHLPFGPREEIRTHHEIDLPAVLGNREPRVIDLRGLFLRYEYFLPYKQAIRDHWLCSGQGPAAGPHDLRIHIRSGDVWQAGAPGQRIPPEYHTPPFSYFRNILQERRWSSVEVVTQNPTDPMVQKIAAFSGAAVISGAAIDDFNRLRASSNLVMSVSTFAWWAGWLSDAKRIYFPLLGLLDPQRARNRPPPWRQDLLVTDERRYIPVTVATPSTDWGGSEEERMQLLDA